MMYYAEVSVLSVELMMQCTPGGCMSGLAKASSWHVLCLFWFCLFRASTLRFFSPGTPASFHNSKTDLDRHAGMISPCPVYSFETHIELH